MLSAYFHPNGTPKYIINMLNAFQKHSKKENYYIALTSLGINNYCFLAISPNTGGLVCISTNYNIIESENGEKKLFDTFKEYEEVNEMLTRHLKLFAKTNSQEDFPIRGIFIDIREIKDGNIWKFIEGNNKTPDYVYNFLSKISEFNANKVEKTKNIIHVNKSPKRLLDTLSNILKNTIQNTICESDLTLNGAPIDIDELVSLNGYLPALLIHAAIQWKPALLNSNNKTLGFRIRLESAESTEDEFKSTLGYIVTGIECDKIPYIAMPVGEIIKQSYVKIGDKEVYDITSTFEYAIMWLQGKNHNYNSIYNYINIDE